MSPTARELAELARLGGLVADDLEYRGYRASGVVLRLAQALAALAPIAPADADDCSMCGRPIEQPSTGRRRVYCSPTCKRAAERSRGRNAA